MLFKVLAQTLLPDPLHWQLGCRSLTWFNGYNHKPPSIHFVLQRKSSSNSSIKTDSDEIEPVSLLGIKKQLKNANFEFIDGNSCLKTVCPACEPSLEGEAKKNVYINKTTGRE